MSELLHPGDAGYIPRLLLPKYTQEIGRFATKIVRGSALAIGIRNRNGGFDNNISDTEKILVNNFDDQALRALGLPSTTESSVRLNYQGLGRHYDWHLDNAKNVRLLVNAGERPTQALIAPAARNSEAFLGYIPNESEIVVIELEPGAGYILDNRIEIQGQMYHASPLEEGRTMLRVDAFPEHRDPLTLPQGAIVYPGHRLNL